MSDRPANHGFAAFDPADVGDAKRGRPDFDLRSYAEERGLEPFDPPAKLAGWNQAVPPFTEYVFNQMRGVLPGGDYGVLFHEAWEVESRGEGSSRRFVVPGGYYGSVHKGRGSANLLSFIPVIGNVLGRSEPDTGKAAFDTDSVWVPCTVAAVHLPEATGVAPSFWFRHRERTTRGVGEKLEQFGLPDMRCQSDENPGEPAVTGELLARLMEGQTVPVLERWQTAGFFEARFAYGTLVLRCNGFVPAPDVLAQDAVTLRRQFAEACMPDNAPRAFEEPLGARRQDDISIPPDPEWQNGLTEFADRHRLTHEDPLEYHRAFPRLGHPGQAVAVMRGPERRVVYYAENYVGERQTVRGALVARAAPGVEPTPPGGVRVPEERLVYEVTDGLVLIWSLETWGWRWSQEDTFVERARALADDRALYA